MENLYVAIFVILIGANFEIGRAFYADEDISVDKAVDFYNSIPGLSWRVSIIKVFIFQLTLLCTGEILWMELEKFSTHHVH